MKLYDYETFLKLPNGTIYSIMNYEYVQNLCIKYETYVCKDGKSLAYKYIDYNELTSYEAFFINDKIENNPSFSMEEIIIEDSQSSRYEIFCVFEKEDLIKIKGYIEKAIEIQNI